MKKKSSQILSVILAIVAVLTIAPYATAQTIYENGAIEAIMQRKSVRKYLDKEVEESKIDILIRAGMAAPTGMGLQPWELVVVTDKEVLDQLAEGLPRARMLKDARQAIIVCGDSIKSFYWYLDCSAVTQNILVAAESLGLGGVWAAAYPYPDRMEVVKSAIGLPDHILPLCIIPFGYPAAPEQPKNKYKPEKIHRNKFTPYTEKEDTQSGSTK